MNLQELKAHDWTVYTEAELTKRLSVAHADQRRARSRQSGNFYAALIVAVEAELTARRTAPAPAPDPDPAGAAYDAAQAAAAAYDEALDADIAAAGYAPAFRERAAAALVDARERLFDANERLARLLAPTAAGQHSVAGKPGAWVVVNAKGTTWAGPYFQSSAAVAEATRRNESDLTFRAAHRAEYERQLPPTAGVTVEGSGPRVQLRLF